MKEKIETIFKENYGEIFGVIYTKTKDKNLSHEIIQQTFFKLLLSKAKPKDNKLVSYVIVSAINTLLDYFRKTKQLRTYINYNITEEIYEIKDNNFNIEETFINNDNNKYIWLLINKLSVNLKELIIYRYYYKLTFKQISVKTNVSINTALGRHRYAIKKLKKLINEKKNI